MRKKNFMKKNYKDESHKGIVGFNGFVEGPINGQTAFCASSTETKALKQNQRFG